MGACNLDVALEWDESNASCGRSGVSKSAAGHPQGSGPQSRKHYMGMLANVSLIRSIQKKF